MSLNCGRKLKIPGEKADAGKTDTFWFTTIFYQNIDLHSNTFGS